MIDSDHCAGIDTDTDHCAWVIPNSCWLVWGVLVLRDSGPVHLEKGNVIQILQVQMFLP